MVVENFPKSHKPVDKLQDGNRLGRRRKPQERLSAVAAPLGDAHDSRGASGASLAPGTGRLAR